MNRDEAPVRTNAFIPAVVCGSSWAQVSASTKSLQGAALVRRALSLALCALMILFPMGEGDAFAQMLQPGPAAGTGEPSAEQEALTPDELDQLVAPVALYPDALLAQVLAASTYPAQVVEANRWLKTEGNIPPERIAERADRMGWDPSVKALTAFPSVLDRMDRNIKWTTDLGNAYYNQPEDVMDAVQVMRAHARDAGNLRSTQQQTVSEEDGAIVIVPANPAWVYVPVYDPWAVWGYAIVPYSGFYFYAPPGIFVGGLLIGFGIGIGVWGHWGWGWHHWRVRWHDRYVFYNNTRYRTRSRTVIRRHFRPRPPAPRRWEPRVPVRRPGGGFQPGVPPGRRVAPAPPRTTPSRPGATRPRPGATTQRPGATRSRPEAGSRPSGGRSTGGGRSGAGGHSGGGRR
jgi:uncharacterized membrane protein YgcG